MCKPAAAIRPKHMSWYCILAATLCTAPCQQWGATSCQQVALLCTPQQRSVGSVRHSIQVAALGCSTYQHPLAINMHVGTGRIWFGAGMLKDLDAIAQLWALNSQAAS